MTQHVKLDRIPEELRMASQSRLVVMIYDEIADALSRAIAAAETGAIQDRCNAVTEAMELVAQLALAIDVDQGGEIADNLARIYKFILAHLPWINLRNDPAPAREALRLIEPLRDAWLQLDARVAEGKVPGFDGTPAIASLLARTSADLAYAIAAE
ncbi:MAG TPA: flagellar export chaperone FliS [Acidothermaceae bacterium]|jgi:flagellar protein FliS